jgi:plasmid stability protein
MPSILVRNLDSNTIERLKAHAAEHGRSVQAEAKAIIEKNVNAYTMAEFRRAADRMRKKLSGRKQSDSTELIREDRRR